MKRIVISLFIFAFFSNISKSGILVLQTDFGLTDSAVAEMKGVALSVDENIKIIDNTHYIEPFNIWEGAFRLFQSINVFPEKSVFVSVVDPGVGTDRKSIVVKTKDNRFIVAPDNGTITFVAKEFGIEEAREIDETKHRLKNSEDSYTFYGRDVYAYTGAKLASGKITFEDVGKKIDLKKLKILNYKKSFYKENALYGSIPALDVNYGNVWSNINRDVAKNLELKIGNKYDIFISNGKKIISIKNVSYANTFGDVEEGKPFLYFNSLNCLAVALNRGDFAKKYGVNFGEKWNIKITKSSSAH